MCISFVCGLLCKILSFIVSLLFIVGLVLLILWLTGIIFKTGDDKPVTANYETLRGMWAGGGGGGH